ncbi:MAG: glycosyltransferase family 4 protein [Candidatus Nealsonbacteria bacterium]
MKKVLFIGVTNYNLEKPEFYTHLRKKFEGLNKEVESYILAKGKVFHKKIWGTEFYLLPSTVLFWPMAISLAFWLCLSKRIDVVVAQSPLIEGFVGAIIKKILKKELIVEIHGDWVRGPFLSKKRRLAFIERKFIPFLSKTSFKTADKIRGVTFDLIKQAQKIAPDKKYFFFPTFTDLDDFLSEKDIRFEEFVLFVGRAQKVKGVEYLIEAFSKIQKDFPSFKLVLMGEGLPEGRLSLEGIRNKMKNCYCLVVPSLSEGLPRVILEAQSLSKPVVASRVGGIPEIIENGKNGFLVEPGDSNDLAEKLKSLLNNKELAVAMGKRGKEIIQDKFSNDKYIENYLKMISSSC